MAGRSHAREELAALIRQELIRNGMRQNSLAVHMGVTPAAISQLLNGKIAMKQELLNRICEILHVSASRAQEMRRVFARLRDGDKEGSELLGDLIAKRRTEYGLSRSELAARSGVNEGFLEILETCPSYQNLKLNLLDLQGLARVLNYSLGDLLAAAGNSVDTNLPYRQHTPMLRSSPGMLREPHAEYNAGYGGLGEPPIIMRFQEFWRRVTAANRPLFYGDVAAAAELPPGRAVELIMRGYELELSEHSAWKLTIKDFENFYACDLALVRRCGELNPFVVVLDSVRSRRVGRKLFRKANISVNINEVEFDIIVPVEKLETIPHGAF